MSDLVNRLRWRADKYDGLGLLVWDLREAAGRMEELEKQLDGLKPYLKHGNPHVKNGGGCIVLGNEDVLPTKDHPCTCGLTAILQGEKG